MKRSKPSKPLCADLRRPPINKRGEYTHSASGLFIRILVVVIAASVVVLVLYTCLFPTLHIKTCAGLAVGILSAAGIAFYWIGQTKKLAEAFIGALAVALVVLLLSMFLILNVHGS
jgi:hypothetical protein